MSDLGPAVLVIGSRGDDRCVDGTVLAPGVHLLWSIEPGLGFPVGGYDVARRAHQAPEWLAVSFEQAGRPESGLTWSWGSFTLAVSAGPIRLDPAACRPVVGLALPGARTLTVGCRESAVAVRASGTGTPPVIEVTGPAAGPDAVLARRTADATATGWSVELWATGITAARINGEDLVVCTLDFGLAGLWEGWRPLTSSPILLPLVPPGSRNQLDLVDDRAATVTRARSRLPGGLPTGVADQLAADFAELPRAAVELLLREGPGARLPATAASSTAAGAAPRLGLAVTTVLALAALDPDVSRMLGLTFRDPDVIGRWDYRVVAHYGPVPGPGVVTGFDTVLPGTIGGGVLRAGELTVAGSGGLEVLAAPDGSQGAVLRVQRPLPGAPAGLILPAGTRSVRLRLAAPAGADGIVFTAARGSLPVASVTGDAGQQVAIEDAGGFDIVTWTEGPLELVEVEVSDTAGPVGDQAGYAWNVSAADRTPAGAMSVVDVGADADVAQPGPDGRLPASAGVIGLDWQVAGDIRDAGLPVRAQVALSPRGDSDAPAAHGPFTVVGADRPPLAVARDRDATGPWPGPAVPQRWTHTVENPGWYAVRVRGIDAFGRLGPWTGERTVQVDHAPTPGAPEAMTAGYLDPADPTLSEADRALCGATAGVLAGWTWPAGRRLAAPAVEATGEFRVYLRRGDPNVLSGTVIEATRDGDRSHLGTDLDWPGPADALTGQLLRLGSVSYPILGHGSGTGISVDVAHLAAPLSRPGTGPCSITLSPAVGRYVGFGRPADFDLRAAITPAQLPVPVTATLTAVVTSADGAEVTLSEPVDLAISGPATPDLTVTPVAGLLLSHGVAYPVLTQNHGSAVVGIGVAARYDSGVTLPAVGDRCTVWAGARYQLWLPGATLVPEAGEAFAVGFAGVAASDGDPAVADDPRWAAPRRGGLGARPGREGPTGRAARLAVPHRVPPPALPVTRPPDIDGDLPAVQAEPADWYGRARWAVPLAAVGGVVGYRVLRTSTAALFAYDLSLRRTGRGPYADGPFPDDAGSLPWLAQEHPSVTLADLAADPATLPADVAAEVAVAWRDWSAWYYPRLSNRAVMNLADLDTHREPFQPAHPGTVPGPSYVDTMDGRGAGRFLYRIRTVDASGTAGPWSATMPIVELRDVTAPKPPTLLSILGEEDAVSLAWRSGTEPDLAGYRIWRAADVAELTDVRRLPPYVEVAANGADAPGDQELWTGWTDDGLAPLSRWYYRVAAVDRAGNVSAPTAVVSAQPIHTEPPEPPAWTQAVRDGATVLLGWTVEQDGVLCMVERQRGTERIFTSRSGWLPPTAGPREFGWTDEDPGSGAATYRIRARDITGNEQRYRWNPVTVPAVEEGP
ncbi:hypothetical protein ACPPVO_24840 [Dactylosporangium sp. McL0621]|uniref:hypothetical protein n=1 Tax=Dactylosporangium sp. McL0621 TaxID=3415678 RepID=UPI003CF04467